MIACSATVPISLTEMLIVVRGQSRRQGCACAKMPCNFTPFQKEDCHV